MRHLPALLAALLLAGCAEPPQPMPMEERTPDLPHPCETLGAFWTEPGLYAALGEAGVPDVAAGPLLALRAPTLADVLGAREVQTMRPGGGGVGLEATSRGVSLTLDMPPGASDEARAEEILRAMEGLADLTREDALAWAREMRVLGGATYGAARFETWRGARDLALDVTPRWDAVQSRAAQAQRQPGLGHVMVTFVSPEEGERVSFFLRTGLRILDIPPSYRLRADPEDGVALLDDTRVPAVYYAADDANLAWHDDMRAAVTRAFAAKGLPPPVFRDWDPQPARGACPG